MAETDRDAASTIRAIADGVERHFQAGRRVLSFAEFLELFETDPVRYSRDSSRYLRDVFDHYGTEKVLHPWGEFTRWKLFDLPWEEGGTKNALIGQEFFVQDVRLVGVEECRPCYWMDRALAAGAESWLRGRGGLRCRILSGGWLRRDLVA